MRIFDIYIIIFISTFFICAQCEKNEIELLNPDAKITLQHNYLIITSADGQPAQVEVKYTVLGIGGENEQKTLRETTPFIFGGENVCCSYSTGVALIFYFLLQLIDIQHFTRIYFF